MTTTSTAVAIAPQGGVEVGHVRDLPAAHVDPSAEFLANLRERVELATMLAKSGMIPQRTPEAALAVMLKGHELGVPTMAAFANIHFFDGKLTLAAGLQLAVASNRFGVRARIIESTALACAMVFTRPGWADVQESFDIEEAKAAGLLGKDNWRKWPKDMLYARCSTRGIKRICPEVGAGLYDPDEMGVVTSQTGEVPQGQQPSLLSAETVTVQGIVMATDAELEDLHAHATRVKAGRAWFAWHADAAVVGIPRDKLSDLHAQLDAGAADREAKRAAKAHAASAEVPAAAAVAEGPITAGNLWPRRDAPVGEVPIDGEEAPEDEDDLPF